MANIGNFQTSLVSVRNEISPALVNVNLHISLFRGNPAVEFQRVGSALTAWRRKEAEDGILHKTACRLGFLFNDILPDTPELLKAIGIRASDILDSPNINPQGTTQDGPFKDFIGADGTCIWAAATSTPASIGAYLLACILARVWDAKTATSIWVELIHDRKAQVQALIDARRPVNPYTEVANYQDITRDDLAKWDASARAWLRRADRSMDLKHNQFTLIMNNVNTPFIDTGTMYEKVTRAWIRALETMERLLNNKPQQADDKLVLFAISSWHLYPNLLVLQKETTNVVFGDRLFHDSAVLSLGLECRMDQKGNFKTWSLALSHLRYYGNSVSVRSEESLDQRISGKQIWLVAMGTTLRQWQVSLSNVDGSIAWFEKLGKVIQETVQRNSVEISWLRRMCDAVLSFSTSSDSEQKMTTALVKFGHRRALHFLGSQGAVRNPYFGLADPGMFGGKDKHKTIEVGFQCLRKLAARAKLRPDQTVLSYTDRTLDGIYTEWATLTPQDASVTGVSYRSHIERGGTPVKRNARWISFRPDKRASGLEKSDRTSRRAREISLAGDACKVVLNTSDVPQYHNQNQHQHSTSLKTPKDWTWENPPPLFNEPGMALDMISFSFSDILGLEFDILVARGQRTTRGLDIADMYLQTSLLCLDKRPDPDTVMRKLLSSNVKGQTKHGAQTVAELQPPSNTSTASESSQNSLRSAPLEWLVSLRALEIASALYDNMPTATISLRIVEQKLHKARWLPESLRSEHVGSANNVLSTSTEEYCRNMSRENSLACIAMFESGIFNISTDETRDVIAMSCEDSIFVAGILLSDPRSSSLGNLGMNFRHLVGNVGKPGMVLMIAPRDPMIRARKYNTSMIQHQIYDGKSRDSFQGTSLHLSFTDWKLPLGSVDGRGQTGQIDNEVVLIESVIAVQQDGQWVADIDVLQIERAGLTTVDDFECICDRGDLPEVDIVTLDSWEELLDPPASPAIMRANKNWAARLAAASILTQQGHNHCLAVLGDDSICWRCLNEAYTDPEPHFPNFIIH
ncbi:hypothetical protein CaCOL14_007166 [Colletotrichum acutatum]